MQNIFFAHSGQSKFAVDRSTLRGRETMRMWKSVLLALTLVLSLFVASSARAQTLQNGAVRGTVYDTSHAVVSTARVTLSNPERGLTRDQAVGADGFYSFDNVPPGVYTIVATADGFAVTTVKQVNISVGSALNRDLTTPVKTQ